MDAPVIWSPQIGPQQKAIRASFVDELLFGGARGGGKTDFLLGDFAADVMRYGENWRGILFRRTYSELDEVVNRGKGLFYSAFPGTEYKVGASEFRFPNGAVLKLRHLDQEGDADHYQGHQYCVGVDTLIRMADGSSKPISEIQVGEWVATLQGPRPVSARLAPYKGSAVAFYTEDCQQPQIHPISHPVLSESSWSSYATGNFDHGKSATRLYGRYVKFSTQLSRKYMESSLNGEPSQLGLDPDASRFFDGSAYGQIGQGIGEDYQFDYLSHRRSHGEQPLSLLGSAPSVAPSPVCVALPRPGDWTQGDLGSIPSHIPVDGLWYAHPYSGKLHLSKHQFCLAPFEAIPCGERWVTDITVEGSNHYISADPGIVNKNTWIGWDEMGTWPTDGPFKKLKATLRSPHDIPNKRIRCTANPGGVGHQWVRAYFKVPRLDEPDGQLIQDGRISKMFIRSLVTDNRILLQNDDKYIDRLYEVGDEQLVKAWLTGDWDSFVGQYFINWKNDEIEVHSFEVPESWPLLAGLDYGEAAPTSFGLYTIDHDKNIYRIMEYYQDNAAASQHAHEIQKMIASCPFTGGRSPSQIFADPSMFVKRRLHEVVSQSPADVFGEYGLFLTPANNDRITGWRVINDALVRQRFHAFAGWNNNLMRTMPALPRSKNNPEDVDTKAEDHAADELRYLMLHIYAPAKEQKIKKANPFSGNVLIDEMRAFHKRLNRRVA